MPWIAIIRGAGALLYAVLPYTLLLAAAGRRAGLRLSRPLSIARPVMTGLVLFLVCVTVGTERSLTGYVWGHHLLTVVSLLVYGVCRYHCRTLPATGFRHDAAHHRHALALGLLLTLVLSSRLALGFADGEGLGGGDARFHNILAHATLENGRSPRDWLPVASVPVMYPRGVHAATAFVSLTAGIPVHQALQLWLCAVAVLSTLTVHHIAARLFRGPTAGMLAATAYAFMAVLGSLDYTRWTGLPNAIGMQLNLHILYSLVAAAQAPRTTRRWLTVSGGVTVLAILLVHHYSLIVCALLLGPVGLLAPRGPVRRMTWQLAAWATVFCLAPILSRYVGHAATLGQTGVLVFREPPIGLVEAGIALGLPFCTFLTAALVLTPPNWRGARYFPVLCWFVLLAASFTALQYGYRFVTLWLSGGDDSYTALTPSRMLTNTVYPGSILIGGLTRWPRARRAPAVLMLVTVAAAAFTSLAAWPGLIPHGPSPAAVEAATWIRDHAPDDIVVAGDIPQLGYLTWRRQQLPPLPASEPRNAPALLALRRLITLDAWRAWRAHHELTPWFVEAADSAARPGLRTRFTNDVFAVRSLED